MLFTFNSYAQNELPLSLKIESNKSKYNSNEKIIIYCELINIGNTPINIPEPYFGDDYWVVNDCYGALPVPKKVEKVKSITIDKNSSFSFKRILKWSESAKLFLLYSNSAPIKDRSKLLNLWKLNNITSQPTFEKEGTYKIRLELDKLKWTHKYNGFIISNELVITIVSN